MVADVKTDIDREMRESELADLRKLGDEISDVKNEFQSAAGKVADDSGVESVVESIKKSADDIPIVSERCHSNRRFGSVGRKRVSRG